MDLQEAIDFWQQSWSQNPDSNPPAYIDAESVPGWVIALRCPQGRSPYVEMWWAHDFIAETEIHAQTQPEVRELSQ